MTEPLENIEMLCSACAPKPMAYEGVPEALIGKFVKRAFIDEDGHTEHMWVKVRQVTDDGVLCGRLSNDPVVVNAVKHGDAVSVRLCDIEEVIE